MKRKYTNEERERIVDEALKLGNIKFVADKYGIRDTTIHYWLKYSKNAKTTPPKELQKDNKNLKDQNSKLKQLLGEKDLKIMMLEEMLRKK